MKKFAVSHIDWFSHDLQTKIVEAETKELALAASEFYDTDGLSCIAEAPTWEEAKQYAFDMDSMFEVVEIV